MINENIQAEVGNPYLGKRSLSLQYTLSVSVNVDCKKGLDCRECDWPEEFAKLKDELRKDFLASDLLTGKTSELCRDCDAFTDETQTGAVGAV